MMDTRAPVEFAHGSFPNTVNLPLMTDDERALVGTCYKQQGQEAAIDLGHSLVHGAVKSERVEAWLDFARRNPDGYLFCFRGGLRSQICQQWMREAGCDYPRIHGGYKAMRRFLIDTLETQGSERRFILLAGHTGAAKTALLARVPNSLDLEGMAHHRGSAFGKRPGGQPAQIGFENSIAAGLLQQAERFPAQATVLEDESRLIGKLALPQNLREAMARAPLVLLQSTLAQRVEHTFENYILAALHERREHYGQEQGFTQFADYLRQSLANIQRRLGGARYQALDAQLMEALVAHERGDPDAHRGWIEALLVDYYDPMYSYQMDKKRDQVVFAGDADAVYQYLTEET
ncbi:tRNA 2-selenouridine(34) synthase MnmH [Mangrovimicrobium sediminis]|uniref:tRNA 2-selenouridine synthase n=2 Tax=Mangrovimicrobium sediminis TaxID=2562682 RepID=A0A4Z0LUB4_9GAMM|nr:tRNA 2-selenouridine(34) synthase MnmH [Haliea sp. SAOS-164]